MSHEGGTWSIWTPQSECYARNSMALVSWPLWAWGLLAAGSRLPSAFQLMLISIGDDSSGCEFLLRGSHLPKRQPVIGATCLYDQQSYAAADLTIQVINNQQLSSGIVSKDMLCSSRLSCQQLWLNGSLQGPVNLSSGMRAASLTIDRARARASARSALRAIPATLSCAQPPAACSGSWRAAFELLWKLRSAPFQ